MDAELRQRGREAVARLDHVLDRGPEATHAEIQAATLSVITFRDRAIEKHRDGTLPQDCLGRANGLVSLAYGGEFPLSGLHLHRLEQTRDGLTELLDVSA